MSSKALVLAFFASALLFSMVREWGAPAACPRAILLPQTPKTAVR